MFLLTHAFFYLCSGDDALHGTGIKLGFLRQPLYSVVNVNVETHCVRLYLSSSSPSSSALIVLLCKNFFFCKFFLHPPVSLLAKGGKRGVLWLRLCCARTLSNPSVSIPSANLTIRNFNLLDSPLKRGDFVVSAQSNDKGVCNFSATHPQPNTVRHGV